MDLKNYYGSGDAGGECAEANEERVERVVEWSVGTSGVVLDIGCSDGRIAERLRHSRRKVVGVDLNPIQLRAASERLDSVLTFDITSSWPFRSSSVAGIHMGAVIEHVFDYKRLFAEAGRVLRDGGSLWISTPNMACLRHRVEVLLGRMPAWYLNFEHIRPWTIEWLDEVVREYGLARTRLAGAHIKTSPIHRIISKASPRLSSIFVAEYRRNGVSG